MAQAIKIIIICGCSYYAAYFVLARLTAYKDQLRKYFLGSMLVIACATLTHSIFLGYVAAAFMGVLMSRGLDASSKIALFFGTVFAVTQSVGVELRPGVDLGWLTYPRILILCILLPLILFSSADGKIRRLNALDKAILFLFIWIFLLDLRKGIGLGTFRVILWSTIDYLVPYFAIRLYLRDYGLVFAALAFSLLAQSIVGAFESILTWHIYSDLERITNYADPFNTMYKIRGAFLRAQATFMNPLIFAMFTNLCCLCMVIIARRIGMDKDKTQSRLFALGGIGLAILGTLSTGSRAGIAGSVLIILVMIMLMWAINRPRDPKKLFIFGGVLAVILLFTVGDGFLRENFEYRMRLLEQSSLVIQSNPLTGIPDIYKDPRMLVMMQGEGIIDMVNTYLIFGVYYGLPGLFAFAFLLFYGMSKLYDGLRYTQGEKLTFGVLCFASLFVMSFNLATTSAFGWQYHWIWINLAISSNIIARIEADRRAANASKPIMQTY